ncbi:MAG TPA: fibronectin type III domain-containing protein [Desulfuromonadales bacterium]|nr:fibronectin type III domain-containing protein [Desulfuromonadales bacterium]
MMPVATRAGHGPRPYKISILYRLQYIFKKERVVFSISALILMLSGACGITGPSIEARQQTISFGTAPQLSQGGSATVTATASSGLAISYSSTTPNVCTVDAGTGIVTDLIGGTCTIAANQSGNSTFAPAPQVTQSITVNFNPDQTISFGPVPVLSFGGTARVTASASSALAVRYSSMTPTVCMVDSTSGLVTDLTVGTCSIAADQPGDTYFNPAPRVIQSITVSAPSGSTVPAAPTGVLATAGTVSNTVSVIVGTTNSGGSPITGYTVTSKPAGISATGTAFPLTVSCPSTCSGYAFSVTAANALGSGAPSEYADVITAYNVVETFYEPDTQPNNSIFIGSFTFNATTGTVTNLRGTLSESMTGGAVGYPNDTMTWLTLNNQLSSVYEPTLGGVLVTTFLLPTTNTLSTAWGGNGWEPGTGNSQYYGFPGALNPKAGGVGNAYARIFVNTANPAAALTQAQVDKLAYADCAAGGMMSSVCMTGTTIAGYGTVGSMSGYPKSQIITKGLAE